MRYFKRQTFTKAASDLALNFHLSLLTKRVQLFAPLLILLTVLAVSLTEPVYLDGMANNPDTNFSNSSTEERVFGYSKTGEYATPVTERTLHNLQALLDSGNFVITVSGPDVAQEYKIYPQLPILPDGEVEQELIYPILCIYDTKYNVLLKGLYPVDDLSAILDIEYEIAKPAFLRGFAALTLSGLALAGFVSLVTLLEIWSSV